MENEKNELTLDEMLVIAEQVQPEYWRYLSAYTGNTREIIGSIKHQDAENKPVGEKCIDVNIGYYGKRTIFGKRSYKIWISLGGLLNNYGAISTTDPRVRQIYERASYFIESREQLLLEKKVQEIKSAVKDIIFPNGGKAFKRFRLH